MKEWRASLLHPVRAGPAFNPIRGYARVTHILLDGRGDTLLGGAVATTNQVPCFLVPLLGSCRARARRAAAADTRKTESDGCEEEGGDGAPHETEGDTSEFRGFVVMVEMITALDVVGATRMLARVELLKIKRQ